MKIGFTGTSWGMTPSQKAQVHERLLYWAAQGADEFHHGLCIGADEQAADIAHDIGYKVVAHPGYSPKNPENRMYRSDFLVIAAPRDKNEEIRSGTWTTVRYARKKKRNIELVYP
jgi:hypothetical protein